jgi:uncharacterized protein
MPPKPAPATPVMTVRSPRGTTVPPAIRPIPMAPALLASAGPQGPAAVVLADLHLGVGAGPDTPLGPPGSTAPELASELVRLCRSAHARRAIVLGDVKHPIVGVPPWLRGVVFGFFATLLEQGIVPEVVLGNHDVGLVPHLPREVVVHPASGWARGGLGLFHGHRWPLASVLDQRTLVAGHLHPGYRFAPTADAPMGKRRCWVRVRFGRSAGVERPDGRPAKARELIVLPAFHPLAGTESLNRERPERGRSFLYRRFLARGLARAYLLDGTDLGTVPIPAPAAPAARSERASRGR